MEKRDYGYIRILIALLATQLPRFILYVKNVLHPGTSEAFYVVEYALTVIVWLLFVKYVLDIIKKTGDSK